MVFQDPTDSLNPRFTAARAIADPIMQLGNVRGGDALRARCTASRTSASPWTGNVATMSPVAGANESKVWPSLVRERFVVTDMGRSSQTLNRRLPGPPGTYSDA